jgi:hypothetical protein
VLLVVVDSELLGAAKRRLTARTLRLLAQIVGGAQVVLRVKVRREYIQLLQKEEIGCDSEDVCNRMVRGVGR